jgi:hypothetical protein
MKWENKNYKDCEDIGEENEKDQDKQKDKDKDKENDK